MKRRHERSDVRHRAHDVPDIDDYTFEELRQVCEFYDEFKRANGQVSCSDIAKQFKCSDIKARVLLSAAEFKEKMRKKGLA